MEPGFPRTVTIYGVGLIGGSLALALRKHYPAVQIFGVDTPETLDVARRLHMIDAGDPGPSDLVILATPVRSILELLGKFRESTGLVLDVGSTKLEICRRAEQNNVAFVGGHPMTGTERSGPEAASADLFSGSTFFLCEVKSTPPGALPLLSGFLKIIGANPVEIDPGSHDRIVAQISHLPQILSTLLADYTSQSAQFAGPGVKSMTRLAASPFHVWRDIFETSEHLPHELEVFLQRARSVIEALEKGDFQKLETLFDRANRAAGGFQ